MKISLCVITKGDSELESLQRMVASFAPYVDYICITTNHEHEKTKEWIESKGYSHSHLDWNNDFSEQRNFNFSQAPKDTDYIIWADSDDVLVGGEHLRTLAKIANSKDTDTVFLSYWYSVLIEDNEILSIELHHPRERLMRPGKTTWRKRIHETPVEVEGINYSYSHVIHTLDKPHQLPVAIVHLGSDNHLTKEKHDERNKRNRTLLELELEDERKQGKPDPRTILYLMRMLSESLEEKDLNKCILLGEEYLSLSGWDEERSVALSEMAKCHIKFGEYEKAKDLLHKAIDEWHSNPLTYLLLADTYFNLGLYPKFLHWLSVGLSLETDENSSSMHNLAALKTLAAELLLKKYMYVEKDIKKAQKASDILYSQAPTQNNLQNKEYIAQLADLNDTCEYLDKLARQYAKDDNEKALFGLLQSAPRQVAERPFMFRLKNTYLPPKVWSENEICYFANFGGAEEKWDITSLETGIGGSETAVIQLSIEWATKGYTVYVYGNPITPGITYQVGEGKVIFMPHFAFNPKDKFHTFIQWRDSSLCGRVSAKRFFVDLHDIYHETSINPNVDKIFVKSNYHKNLAPNIPSEKFVVISNGI